MDNDNNYDTPFDIPIVSEYSQSEYQKNYIKNQINHTKFYLSSLFNDLYVHFNKKKIRKIETEKSTRSFALLLRKLPDEIIHCILEWLTPYQFDSIYWGIPDNIHEKNKISEYSTDFRIAMLNSIENPYNKKYRIAFVKDNDTHSRIIQNNDGYYLSVVFDKNGKYHFYITMENSYIKIRNFVENRIINDIFIDKIITYESKYVGQNMSVAITLLFLEEGSQLTKYNRRSILIIDE